MGARRGKVIHLHQVRPQAALEHLNRLTGLRFYRWPESLVQPAARSEAEGCSDRTQARID